MLTRAHLEIPPIHLLRARVDLERFAPLRPGEEGPVGLCLPEGRKILCFGRLVKRKGVDRAIRVMPRVRAAVPDAQLLIAGTGPERKDLERAAREDRSITFLGRVADACVPALYASADVFTLPVADRWGGLEVEGLGVVLLEASASGTPCVTGRSGGTPEAVIDKKTGLVVDARNDAALADALIWMLTHPEEARSMGGRAREHVAHTFGEAAVPPALLDWLR
jgi:phosphatidylinositol alpha-1,6-mannosyltransferase